MDRDASFGHWLTLRRKALRLSRVELARRVGCAVVTLRKIETDERRPSRQIAIKLAGHLNIALHEHTTFVEAARGEIRVDRLPPADRVVGPILKPGSSNLPIPLTSLIGRAAEVAAVRELLLRGDVRLLTLIGAPGIGKTRLSLQVATELRDTFGDGVSFVPLAPLSDPGLLLATIAQALGVPERAGQPVRYQLEAYLRDRELLLVLDNFEHLLQSAPQLVELLAAASRLALLVTSRVALRLAGEQRFAVPPLVLPPRSKEEGGRMKDEPGAEHHTGAESHHPSSLIPHPLIRYAALDLFVARARTVQPRFALTETYAPVVAEICVRLDGLPLAIELAAARINLFTPQEVLARLDQRFALLTAGALDLPERQQTLRRAIDWSYDLLDEAERRLFRRLGVFKGSWTLEAAAAVLRTEGRGLSKDSSASALSPQPSVLDGLAALVDKSLLQREEASDGRSRFTMLETIREYALERLAETGELAPARERHLTYYLTLAEAAEPRLSASDQLVWLDRLEQDHDNLRAALGWAVDCQPEAALRLSGALTDFWLTRGYLSEARVWLERALAGAVTPLEDSAAGDSAADLAPPATVAARAKALHGAGMLAHVQEDNARAEALFVKSLALAQAIGDRCRIARLLSDLGELAMLQGNLARAEALCRDGLALARAADDRGATAHLLLGLGAVAQQQGDLRLAADCYEEGLALGRALDDRRRIAWALQALGQLALAQGARQRAADMFAEGVALARSVGDHENTAWLLYFTGRLMLEQHDLAGAAAQFAESARLLQELGAGQGIALNLVGLAAMMIQQQKPAQAARLLGAAEAQHWVASVADERAEFDHAVAVVRAQLDQATFATAWAAGRAMTLEQALSLRE